MEMDKEKILKAGSIVSKVREYARTIVKNGIPLLELAEKIESKILELGGKAAFPVNLSINEIAAHYTPSQDDLTLAHGLIKVDFGVHIDGWTADNSFSVDLENSEENKKLIRASEEALKKAIEITKVNVSASVSGAVIQETIESYGFSPVINLCGHSMKQYELHGGISIPNIDDGRNVKLKEGLYAIEPFATKGSGKIRDGRPSGIYELKDNKKPRSNLARETLAFIESEYSTLPFCSRWLIKKLGLNVSLALRELESNGNLHQFSQLVEISGNKVSQAEHTVLIEKDRVIVTTM
jgi:methionyl aminopeptidase